MEIAMTSVSSLGSNSLSPLQLLQQELAKETANGTVSSTDETALSSALTDIDAALIVPGRHQVQGQ
jgi:hypothetical protein